MKKYILIILTMSICAINMVAQDIVLSQFTATPLNLNPALAGNNACDWRLAVNVRNEWLNISKNFLIGSVSGDIAIGRIKNKKKNFLGVGLLMNMDKAGTENVYRTDILPTLAYHMMLGKDGQTTLSFGLQGGLRICARTAPDPSSVVINTLTSYAGDASFGVLFNQKISAKHSYYIGAAAFHLPQSQYQYLSTGLGSKWNLKFQGNVGAQIGITKALSIMPSFQYNQSNGSILARGGSYVKYMLTDENKTKSTPMSVYVGAWYGSNRTLTSALRFDYGSLNIAFSYDANFNFVTINGTAQAPELSIIYTGCLKKNNNKFGCPTF
jgi:type IX secretion system PorP/SprF family membrane protein